MPARKWETKTHNPGTHPWYSVWYGGRQVGTFWAMGECEAKATEWRVRLMATSVHFPLYASSTTRKAAVARIKKHTLKVNRASATQS